jgi:uncharacterized protein YjbJ (UPF0337 family)
MVKGAFGVGGRLRQGVVSRHLPDGSWSSPVFIQIGGLRRRRSAKGTRMHHDVLQTRWKQFRSELNYRWKHLTPDDLDGIHGKRDHLVVLLERRYGYARRRAEKEVDLFVSEIADRLRNAS